MDKVLEIKNGIKVYKMADKQICALNNVNASFQTGKIYIIYGHSGSGKSTLIQMLGLLDKLSQGNIFIFGKDTNEMTEKESANIRNKNIGFIFQQFFLNKNLSAIENVMVPMYINLNIA